MSIDCLIWENNGLEILQADAGGEGFSGRLLL